MNTNNVTDSIFIEGRNFWKMGKAHRVSFLIDASEYFSAFIDAALKAERTIYITGWDIDSRTRLVCDGGMHDYPTLLGEFINYVASRKPDLHIYILLWDYAILYALEREPFPIWVLDWKTNNRIHFFQDNFLPMGASHHQKIVVIDDRIAFTGGIDLTNRRWDVNEHFADDPRRTDPWGKEYPPFHDVQILADGQVAGILGDLFRSRWFYATGIQLTPPESSISDPWPLKCLPDITRIDIAVSRTEPAYRNKTEIREVEALWLDAIVSARELIYIENPFFTSSKIAGAIAKRLQEENGPEIVVITRKKSHGWLEEYTMDAIREHLVERVRKLDAWGKFGCYYPTIPGREEVLIEVHSKVLIVDDRFIRIGSSNLSNRSMGLDTECDVSMETAGNPQTQKACNELRNRLLAEHLDTTSRDVGQSLDQTGSLIKTIETIRGEERILSPLNTATLMNTILSEPFLVDPERPISAERFVEKFIGKEYQHSGRNRFIGFAAMVLMLILFAMLWRWSPLAGYLDAARIIEELQALRNYHMAPVIILAMFVAGGLVVFPVLLLIVVTSILFDPLTAFILAMSGSLMSAMVVYWIGHALGRDFVRNFAGKRINKLSKSLARQGLLTIVVLRVVPIAPYSIVNLLAGASHIVFRDFIIGTLIGMFPGIFGITVFTESLKHFILEPNIVNIAILAGTLILVVAILVWLTKLTKKVSSRSAGERTP